MTEQDLIDLGFKKITEEPEFDFHYYKHGELLSNDSITANATHWEVILYGEVYDYVFTDINDLRELIALLDRNKQ